MSSEEQKGFFGLTYSLIMQRINDDDNFKDKFLQMIGIDQDKFIEKKVKSPFYRYKTV